jgi:DNA-binding beta-propeller fold protein YncE
MIVQPETVVQVAGPVSAIPPQRRAKNWIATLLAGAGIAFGVSSWAEDLAPLQFEMKIPLGQVRGRIDHFAVDLPRQRLFIAELGNNSVGVVDLKQRKVVRTIDGLRQPQGVGYVASTDTLYVANAGDGSVHLFQGENLAPAGKIGLGDDADNIRVDPLADQVLVGYGNGALGVIDPRSRKKVGEIPLQAHPEGFQIDSSGRVFVNVPRAGQIAVVDRAAGRQTASWSLHDVRENFPMALDETGNQVIVVGRKPARIAAVDSRDGRVVASVETCGDADDVFFDPKRHRIYVSCGSGVVDVLQRREHVYERVGQVPTAHRARTSLFVPDLDRLYVAVPATSGESAAVWVFRPAP